ncbi:MAG: hypothetical protein FH761_06600 [Firmicutes bacterium]|nr:hypothetical protein [Bacillota bacterium]
MKIKEKRILILLVILIFFQSSYSDSNKEILSKKYSNKNKPKTIVIVVNKLDYSAASIITSDNGAIGIINNRTESLYKKDSVESYYMTMATGRRVSIKSGLFESVRKDSLGRLKVEGFNKIYSELLKNNEMIKNNFIMLGDFLDKKEISIGYIGQDASSLLAANKDGIIQNGINSIDYNENWLIKNTGKILEKVDVLVIGFDLNNEEGRIQLLNRYIQHFDKSNILVMAEDISEDMSKKFNNTLSLLIMKPFNKKTGLIYSSTTKRKGIITNLDIFPHIASIYGLENKSLIGNELKIQASENKIKTIKKIFIKSVNLNIIKYILHFIIIILEIFLIWSIVIKGKSKNINNNKYRIITQSIVISIFITLIVAFSDLNLNIPIFIIVVTLSSWILAKYSNELKFEMMPFVDIGIYLMIQYGILFNKPFIYNSFMGYNNILAGGRFYGLNNGIVGVMLASSVLSYFHFANRIKSNIVKYILLIFIFLLNLLSVSSYYGANTGGYLTSIILILIVIYIEVIKFKKEMFKKKGTIILLLIIGVGLVFFNYYLDTVMELSHVGSFIDRIYSLGFNEFWDMIIKKIKQLFFMFIVPPWSIILISQIYFIIKYYVKERIKIRLDNEEWIHRCKEIDIILITSIIGLLINDTGVITFTYMNTFVLARLSSLHNIEKRYL